MNVLNMFKKSESENTNGDHNSFIDYKGQVKAIRRSQAVIEFELDGTILKANDNFLNVMGYRAEEVEGKHHSMFAQPEYAASAKYRQFWEDLSKGEYKSESFLRLGKGGKEVWINASYNPIFDEDGNSFKIVKYASDITEQVIKNTNYSSQLEAISKSQAVIEFNMDGSILFANANFLNALGYSLDEVKGKHHSMFAEPQYAKSDEYRQFWENLNKGEFQTGEYLRIGKGGKQVWIQGSYNPISDYNGKPSKVVKFAIDVTEQKNLQNESERALKEVSKVMLGLADGDLMQRVQGEFSGAFSSLQQAVNQYCENLISRVNRIKEVSSVVGTGAKEISEGNENLSQRTEQQAASLEETSSSMEEMTSTVQQNADNAQQANQLALNAREQAENGGKVVTTAIDAMNEINTSSKKIADIISVIDEIAFQTNLLALNASVEAARAGEQGRGFAVVASEVRNLAGRSATAAKEIKELIEDSVSKVGEGSKLVNKSGETLDEIVNSVKKVTDIIAEISASSQEQASGIDEVNKAVLQMDENTQQNAALVEQAAAASQSMNQEANELTKQIGFFKVGKQDVSVNEINPIVKEERRSANRPWKQEAVKQVQTPTQNVKKVSGSDVDEQEWQEF